MLNLPKSKYVEAIGILEEILRIKKVHFGINSKEVLFSQLIIISSPALASSCARSATSWPSTISRRRMSIALWTY
jgi:hypothetical protein